MKFTCYCICATRSFFLQLNKRRDWRIDIEAASSRNVVVSGQSGFIEYCRKDALTSTYGSGVSALLAVSALGTVPDTCPCPRSVRVERSRDTYRLGAASRHLDFARCERCWGMVLYASYLRSGLGNNAFYIIRSCRA